MQQAWKLSSAYREVSAATVINGRYQSQNEIANLEEKQNVRGVGGNVNEIELKRNNRRKWQ